MRPEQEGILRKHIRSGRIVIGPWHILPDMFLVGPEAHIRNLLLGDQTTRKFGPKMMIGYIPDPFGHPGQVPQIMKGFGIETVSLWRGVEDGPAEFWWDSPDGSRVLMAYMPDGYGNAAELPADQPPLFISMIAERVEGLAKKSATSQFLLMFGTDHMEPPAQTSKAIAFANRHLSGARVIHSTLPNYVKAVRADLKRSRADLPVIRGELRACKRMHLLPGVLSTRIWIKQRNQACETLLTRWVEPFTTFAGLIDGETQLPVLKNPATIIAQAWRLLMENHPHDSICGCSIDQVHDEMKVRFDQVEQIGEELTRQSLSVLAARVDTRDTQGSCGAVVVFNPTAGTRTDLAEADIDLPAGVEDFDLVDEKGRTVPYQVQGLGNKPIVNMIMDPKGLQTTFGAIHDGKAGGMAIQSLNVSRDGARASIEAILSETGEPNLAAWENGRRQVDAYLNDPTISSYHVRARSTSTSKVTFVARHVPGLGFRTLHVRPRPAEEPQPGKIPALAGLLLPILELPWVQKLLASRGSKAQRPVLENEFFRVEARKDGTLLVLDKSSGIRYQGLNRFLDGADCGDEYNYAPPANDRIVPARLKKVTTTHGVTRQTLALELEITLPVSLAGDRRSRSRESCQMPILTKVTLPMGVARIDIHTRVTNAARDHRLRVHFPTPFQVDHAWQDGHFEVVQRGIGVPASDDSWVEQPRSEVPQRGFSDVSDGKHGLMIANRGLPEVEIRDLGPDGREIALTLLRCVGWLSRDDFSTRKGHAGPAMETPGAQLPGSWEFDYAIIPHAGTWSAGLHEARAFESPLRSAQTGIHPGSLPPEASLVDRSDASFDVTTIKETEDGKGWLVRGTNLGEEPIQLRLKPWKPWKNCRRVNLAEETLAKARVNGGSVDLEVGPHETVSLRFER
jgi:alpha-mannosidase